MKGEMPSQYDEVCRISSRWKEQPPCPVIAYTKNTTKLSLSCSSHSGGGHTTTESQEPSCHVQNPDGDSDGAITGMVRGKWSGGERASASQVRDSRAGALWVAVGGGAGWPAESLAELLPQARSRNDARNLTTSASFWIRLGCWSTSNSSSESDTPTSTTAPSSSSSDSPTAPSSSMGSIRFRSVSSSAAVLRGRRPRARWARSAAFPQLLRKHGFAKA